MTSTINLTVVEAHNGQPCDCLQRLHEMVIHVGDKLELTHTHDGCVDKIIATLVSVDSLEFTRSTTARRR